MTRILDPSFRYKPSFETDLRKTFARVRREQAAIRAKSVAQPPARVMHIARGRT
jgi:hypothetical protein